MSTLALLGMFVLQAHAGRFLNRAIDPCSNVTYKNVQNVFVRSTHIGDPIQMDQLLEIVATNADFAQKFQNVVLKVNNLSQVIMDAKFAEL